MEITKLLLISIKEKDFSHFIEEVDNCNDKQKYRERIDSFSYKEEYIPNNLEKKISYLNKAILLTYKKYDIEQVIFALENAIIFTNFGSFTKDFSARMDLMEYVNVKDILYITDIYTKGNLREYINRCIGISEEKDSDKDSEVVDKSTYLTRAVSETYQKYGMDRTLLALNKAYFNNNFSSFTNDNNARTNLVNNLDVYDVRAVILNSKVSSFEDYIKMCVGKTR